MVFVIFTLIVIAVCMSLYGWGLLLHRLAGQSSRNWVVTIIIGLGVIIFLGGVLNLLRVAYGWVFDILLFIGILLAFKFNKFSMEVLRDKNKWFCVLLPALIIVLIMNFTVKTQLPPKVFNWLDDFEKYFVHPVRMLETGTVFGSPLSAVGSQVLGGQAVLHGIVLNHFPIPYINGADAVFGLLLCLLMSVGILPLREIYLPISVTIMFVVFFINPRYVNVSTLYIASAFMMASIQLFSGFCKCGDEKAEKLPSAVLIGLIYASLIALKSNFLLFPPLQLVFFVIAVCIFRGNIREMIRWSLMVAGMTVLFLLPWLLLHLPHYLLSHFSQAVSDASITPEKYQNLFSSKPLLYGSSFVDYTFICIAIILPVLGILLWKRREYINSRGIALAGLFASSLTIIVAYLLMIYLSPILSGYEQGLRFVCPFFIAGAPVILAIVYRWAIEDKSLKFKIFFSGTALLFGIFIVIVFFKSFEERINQASKYGSILAFSKVATNSAYIKYNEIVIQGDTRARIITAQKQIPAGEKFVANINAVFYLNFKRNIVFEADVIGLSNPWAYIPDTDYLMVEYGGPAEYLHQEYLSDTLEFPAKCERKFSKNYLNFRKSIEKMMQNSDALYNDGSIAVFKRRK